MITTEINSKSEHIYFKKSFCIDQMLLDTFNKNVSVVTDDKSDLFLKMYGHVEPVATPQWTHLQMSPCRS